MNAAQPVTLMAFPAVGQTPEVDAAVQLEAAVFSEWFGNTEEQLAAEYAPLAAQMLFVLATYDRQPIGMARLMLPGLFTQKSLVDAGRPPFDLAVDAVLAECGTSRDRTLDLVTIGVAPAARGRRLSRALLAATCRVAQTRACTHLAGIFDAHVQGYLSRQGIPLVLLSATAEPYLGSPASVPAVAEIDAVAAATKDALTSARFEGILL